MFYDREELEILVRKRELEKFLIRELYLPYEKAAFLAKEMVSHKEKIVSLFTEEIEWEA